MTRRTLLAHAWLQAGLVLVIVVLLNAWAARSFLRVDLTEDRLYSLDIASRTIMYRLDKPLVAKVYFTGGLQAPYNNHEQALVDKLEDFRAYSRGLMEIEVVDPTNVKELEEEARRFGIEPIQYRYRSSSVTEMKKVFMGVALVHGGRQEVLPAVTRVETLEYDLARAVRSLVTEEEPKVIGWSVANGEPSLLEGKGPLGTIRDRLAEDYVLKSIELGGEGGVDDEVDALFVVGPQRPLSDRALYQLDQFLMRGGALAVFATNTKPDLRTLRPRNVYHGLEAILGHYGVKLNRDVVVDRAQNGVMRFPVRQGKYTVQMPVNYPLIPRATELDRDSAVVKDLDNMLFPFVSSLQVADNLPSELETRVLAATSPTSGRIKGIRTIDPSAYKVVAGGEERGSFPVLVSMNGSWPSYFADKDIPRADGARPDDPAGKLRQSAPTRLVVSGSADFVANNIAFVLNLADWMLEDESLISIRSKSVQLAKLDPVESGQASMLKAVNILGGSALLLVFGLVRWFARREKDVSPGGQPDAPAGGGAA
ncbi:MAG: GldG family protein [Myxococcota bacterium]|nr:GldG family protein [Myxococcota bacterium]